MYTRTTKRVSDGDAITADDRNYIAAEIDRRNVVNGGGLDIEYATWGQRISIAGTFSNIRMVFTPSGGIPFATTATVGTVVTLTPGSANCFDSTLDSSTGKWTVDTSVTAALKVYNDFTSSTSTNAGVGGKWVMVGAASDGTTRLIGDPC
jgi:hypothetical protein